MRTSGTPISALFVNCSLKRTAADSHTRRLMQRVAGVMRSEGVEVEILHALDHDIAVGMAKDLSRETGGHDDWPSIQKKVEGADILVIGTPIWLGAVSSVAALVIERIYAYSADMNDAGQYIYYGKVAGCVVTGNEDGVKTCARDVLYALQHVGYTIPPQADCGWIGEVGPGPSYGDQSEGDGDVPVGYDNEFTNRNATIMAWNLVHMARLLRDNGGIPAVGNQPDHWREVANAADQIVD
ncbi:MAG: flavodoxin family protein [Acidimicrobiales bacterium]